MWPLLNCDYTVTNRLWLQISAGRQLTFSSVSSVTPAAMDRKSFSRVTLLDTSCRIGDTTWGLTAMIIRSLFSTISRLLLEILTPCSYKKHHIMTSLFTVKIILILHQPEILILIMVFESNKFKSLFSNSSKC